MLAALAACWLLPLLTHLLRLDALLVPVIVLGAMSLLRGGRTVLDQIMVGAAALFGAACLAGIVFSEWPWRMDPLPVAGVSLTALVLTAALTGRRPWPQRGVLRSADMTLLGASAVLVGLTVRPFLHPDLIYRLGILAPGEDFARHFIVYDTIRQIGGYMFLHRAAAAPFTQAGYGLETYPQGWHFVVALLRNFELSTTVDGPGVPEMSWLVGAFVGTFAFMGVAILWSIRRLAGPKLNSVNALVVFGLAVAYIYFADPLTIMLRGYPNELMGLGLLAMVVALAARPLNDVRDQVMVLALLLVGVAFTYYLFLPAAGVAVLAWLVFSRRRLRRHPVTLAAGCLLSLGAVIPPLADRRADNGQQLLLTGQVAAVNRHLLQALLLLVVAGLAVRGFRRSPADLTLVAALAASAVVILAIGVFQEATVGHTVYYYEKAYHGLLVVALVGLAVLPRLLPDPRATGVGSAWRRVSAVLPAVLVSLAGFALVGALPPTTPGGSVGLRLLVGSAPGSPPGAADAIDITQRYPDSGGAINVDLAHAPYPDFYGTLYGAVMQRNYRAAVNWYVLLAPWRPHTLADMEALLRNTPGKVRFLVSDPGAHFLTAVGTTGLPTVPGSGSAGDVAGGRAPTNIEAAEYLAARYPDKVEIVRMPAG